MALLGLVICFQYFPKYFQYWHLSQYGAAVPGNLFLILPQLVLKVVTLPCVVMMPLEFCFHFSPQLVLNIDTFPKVALLCLVICFSNYTSYTFWPLLQYGAAVPCDGLFQLVTHFGCYCSMALLWLVMCSPNYCTVFTHFGRYCCMALLCLVICSYK